METKKRIKRATAYRIVRLIESCNRDGCRLPVSKAWIDARESRWIATVGVTYDDFFKIARAAGYNVRKKEGLYREYVLL